LVLGFPPCLFILPIKIIYDQDKKYSVTEGEVAAYLVCLAMILAAISLGGGIYETSVVDPRWPERPDIIQPSNGGISRRIFWIPAHVIFELTFLAALWAAWDVGDVRGWLLVALASHAGMRIWSGVVFIPAALQFEKGDNGGISAAYRWTRQSRLRLLLDMVTVGSMVMAMWSLAAT
jgi:hypothetical protein